MSDIDDLITKLARCGVPMPLINRVMEIEVGRVRLQHKAEMAYDIINGFVVGIPACSCTEDYTSRGMTDPQCTHCDAVEDDVYHAAVSWRDSCARPDSPLYHKTAVAV